MPNCSGNGLSSPYSRRTVSTISRVAFGPAASAAGSPGAMFETAKVMRALLEEEIDPLLEWRKETVEATLRRFGERAGWPPNELFMAVRVATTGRTASPPLFETLAVLGKETARRRLRRAAEVLKTGAAR